MKRHGEKIDAVLRPDSFPIGSPESRAAARMLAECRKKQCRRFDLVTNALFPDPVDNTLPDPSQPYATPWHGTLDEGLMRMLYVPKGMTEEEARRKSDRRKSKPGR
jgi:hypothetical protein